MIQPEWTHAQLQYAHIGKLQKLLSLSAVIPLSHGQGVGVVGSQSSWQAAAVISCELITSSQFALGSIHHCPNLHNNQSIEGSEHKLIVLLLHFTTCRHLYTVFHFL